MNEHKSVREFPRAKFIGAILIGVYILLRMVADPFFWRSFSEYYSYAFEIAFVITAYFSLRKHVTLLKAPTRVDIVGVIGMVVCGFIIYRFAGWLGIGIPFDLSSSETIFLLLILAPVLEELIFRMALWESFQILSNNAGLTLFATTFLFAAGHFAAYWFVPDQFHSFVIYQTSYVVFLGVITGLRRWLTKSVSSSVLAHFGFNLGFFLASRF